MISDLFILNFSSRSCCSSSSYVLYISLPLPVPACQCESDLLRPVPASHLLSYRPASPHPDTSALRISLDIRTSITLAYFPPYSLSHNLNTAYQYFLTTEINACLVLTEPTPSIDSRPFEILGNRHVSKVSLYSICRWCRSFLSPTFSCKGGRRLTILW